jgi:ketopantoate reductase
MDILVYGAGVMGVFLCSDRSKQAIVTILARGKQLVDIRRHGLVLEDIVSAPTGRRWAGCHADQRGCWLARTNCYQIWNMT